MMQKLLLSLILGLVPFLAEASGPVKTDHVTAELVAESTSIQPGLPFWVGVRLEMIDHWHTYWTNPGDAGLGTSLTWTLPEGFTAGPIIWPTPQRIPLEPLVSYGYEGEVLLMVRIDPPPTLPRVESVDLKVRADWLACHDVCIPGGADLSLVLPVTSGPPTADPAWEGLFAQTRESLPLEGVGWPVALSPEGDDLRLEVMLPEGAEVDPSGVFFFNATDSVIEPAAPQVVTFKDGRLSLLLKPAVYAAGPVNAVDGVLFASGGFGAVIPGQAVAIAASIEGPADAIPLPVASVAYEDLSGKKRISLPVAVAAALLGGLILNLMPCVFPVLSIKILSFVQQAGEDRSRILRHGLVFALGVLVSFWVLAGLLIALRAGGQQLGWGYQLQSPLFIIAIAAVLFLLSLSLLGVFEIGGSLIGVGASARTSGYAGSFMTGVLATIVATPCTAPFMGSALAFALTEPAVVSLTVFTALGLGMAGPYVILSAVPALLRFLPRPGAWMETFKQLMAFPLLATVIWLAWVLGLQVGMDGIARFLFGLLAIAIAAWIYGRWNTLVRSTPVRLAARFSALVFLVAGLYVASTGTRMAAGSAIPTSQAAPGEITWLPYDAQQLEELKNGPDPVFLDFTAAWCLTCKANELVVFRSDEVKKVFREKGIVGMKGDWTTRNPEITRALAQFGRTGVPLYVYFAGDGAAPVLLPEILNPGIVLDVIRGGN
ncbi:MAG: protein-disulfide reductase DsbD family protein [Opitutaceae bacterium]